MKEVYNCCLYSGYIQLSNSTLVSLIMIFFPHFQLDFPAKFPCLLHIAMCSALCNESVLQYNPDRGTYEKIGESTEVALRVFAEKVYLFS